MHETDIKYGYYEVNKDNTAVTISYCDTSAEEGVIPNAIEGLPVTSIGNSVFAGCLPLTNVYYSGTETMWNNIDIADGNDALINSTIHYNGDISTSTSTPNPDMVETSQIHME